MREEDFPLEGERLAEWMRQVDALEPFLSEEEEARWHAALEEDSAHSKANFEKEIADIENLFS